MRAGDGTEGFLPSCIPDLKLYLLVVDGYHTSAELDADRQVMDGLKPLVGKL